MPCLSITEASLLALGVIGGLGLEVKATPTPQAMLEAHVARTLRFFCPPPSENTYLLRGWVNKGKKGGRGCYTPARGVLVISAEALDDPRHLVAVVGTKRRCPEVASRAEF